MDVRGKLVELLNEVQETGVNEIPAGFGCTREYIANEKVASHLTAHGVTVQDWISVDDRMPTQEDAPTEYVFTAYKNQNCYDVEIALLDTVIAYPDLYDYWMALPLPQPPKGE